MIKSIKHNLIKKNLLLGLGFVALFLLYKIFFIAYREEASKIDNETSKISSSIEKKELEVNEVSDSIKVVEKIHNDYLARIEHQKNLTIDLISLSKEVNSFIELLNKYYDNSIFKIRTSSVTQNEDYINVAEINLYFEFNHKLQHTPEVALLLEQTVINSVFSDITNNFKKLINVDKGISSVNFDLKNIKLFYVKEK